MPKILNRYQRKQLLEASQQGLSNTALKEKFAIGDSRTLNKYLKLAQQETEIEIVRLGIIKENLMEYLDEILALIKKWKSALAAPRLERVYLSMAPAPTQNIEEDPLFGSLKEHLPNSSLWRDYGRWKNNVRVYIEGCQVVMSRIKEEGKGIVPDDILRDFGTRSTMEAMSLSEPLFGLREKYIKAVNSDTDLMSVIEQMDTLERVLHESLQRILLRRDHIMNKCDLCPGQTR